MPAIALLRWGRWAISRGITIMKCLSRTVVLMTAAVVAAVLASAPVSASASASVPGPLGMPGTPWRLTNNDGPAQLAQWSPYPYGPGPVNANLEDTCYSPLNVIAGEYLRLMLTDVRCTNYKGKVEPYTGAYLISQWTQRYGAFEADIWLPMNGSKIANWPAFWTVSEAGAIPTSEIDIMEALGGPTCDTYHYNSVQISGPCTFMKPGFHVYGMRWTPTVIIWYIDGRQIWETHKDIYHSPMNVILVNTHRSVYPVVFASERVAWVRSWIG
jgi:hypothetical protein